jgi:hypothetical protein
MAGLSPTTPGSGASRGSFEAGAGIKQVLETARGPRSGLFYLNLFFLPLHLPWFFGAPFSSVGRGLVNALRVTGTEIVMRFGKTTLPALLVILFGAGSARADDAYYIIVFASQHPDNQPKFSHTFAAFVKADDAGGKKGKLEVAVISWLPATGNVAVGRLRPEQGKNFGLKETLDWANEMRANVTAWGPFAIKKELYDSAVRQVKLLDSGTVGYKAVDLGLAAGFMNCIRAVCDLDVVKERLATGKARGEEASEMIVRFLRPFITDAPVPDDLVERLGLAKYKIKVRTLEKGAPPLK